MPEDIRARARERMELRIHARETLETILDWIRATKPSEWLPSPPTKGEDILSTDEIKARWRDWVDKGGNLMDKCWSPAELLADDLTAFMEEFFAKPKGASESKPETPGK